MRLALIIAASALAASTVSVAFAAQIGVGAGRAGGGAAAVVRCDTNGFTLSYAVSSGNVTSVTVAGIADPTCEGASVRVTATSAAGASIGSGTGTVPTDAGTTDNSVVITISPTPSETTLSGIQVALTGP